MGKVLDNPKEFFENLSTEEFDRLLNEYGFEYEDLEVPVQNKRKIKSKITSVGRCNDKLDIEDSDVDKIVKKINEDIKALSSFKRYIEKDNLTATKIYINGYLHSLESILEFINEL